MAMAITLRPLRDCFILSLPNIKKQRSGFDRYLLAHRAPLVIGFTKRRRPHSSHDRHSSCSSMPHCRRIFTILSRANREYVHNRLEGPHQDKSLVASLLEATNQRWIKQTGNISTITKLATSLWSPHEHLTGSVLAFLLT